MIKAVEKTQVVKTIGVGIDTARYGHCAAFLRDDLKPAAARLEFREGRKGYDELHSRLAEIRRRYPDAEIRVRIDAAGQYARNLDVFLRNEPLGLVVSVGEPQRNRNYRMAHTPNKKSDKAEAEAMARYAVVERPPASFALDPQFVLMQQIASRLQGLSKDLTRIINRFHGLMSNVFPELAVVQANLAVAWVLELLSKWPTPERLAKAKPDTVKALNYLGAEKAEELIQRARDSVGTLSGPGAEELVRVMVQEVRHAQSIKDSVEKMLIQAYKDLPAGNYHQLLTIPGVGEATAAVLTSKIIDIARFDSPEKLVGYFGVYPEDCSSGMEREGQTREGRHAHMSNKGNDLVRAYLWNAAFSGITHNPALKDKYARLKGNGKRGDVAVGHCMQKLLHQIWAIWRTGQPFDPERHLRHQPKAASPAETSAPTEETKTAAGLTRESSPSNQEVTAAASKVAQPSPSVNEKRSSRSLDFEHVRSQLRIEQVLEVLNHRDKLVVNGPQLRGPCPVHAPGKTRARHFSASVEKNAFRCFAPECQAKGNALDLYVAVTKLPLHEAAWQLVERLNLEPTTTEKRNP
jgi:transposase